MSRDASTLPEWIPFHARSFYADTGPYSDWESEDIISRLFHSELLQDFFAHLDSVLLSSRDWEVLIGEIVANVECLPPGGRATAERPDAKVRYRTSQTAADQLLGKISKQARALADSLARLEALKSVVPAEACSLLVLLETALKRNPAGDDFRRFRRGLSSYKSSEFPTPADLILSLADAADNHPGAKKIFADDPWLRAQQTSARDFRDRMLPAILADFREIYGIDVRLQEKHFDALTKALINPSFSVRGE